LEGRGRGGLGIPGTWVTAGCDVDGASITFCKRSKAGMS